MGDFQTARRQMVDCQIRPNDITDHDIIDAFLTVPREMFVPKSKSSIAYIDSNIQLNTGDDLGSDRYLMQATPFGRMVQAAEIRPDDLVLCVGCGSGYGAAIIAKLASSVVAIEEDQDLVDRASTTLSEMGVDNLAVIQGSLEAGCVNEAPFGVIFLEGAVDVIPASLFEQLRDGGRLIAVVGRGLTSVICVYHKRGGDISITRHGNVSVPKLPGFRELETFKF